MNVIRHPLKPIYKLFSVCGEVPRKMIWFRHLSNLSIVYVDFLPSKLIYKLFSEWIQIGSKMIWFRHLSNLSIVYVDFLR